MAENQLTYLSLCGMLGYGYPEESLAEGLKHAPSFIGVDNGSTDPGPYYLGSGSSFVRPEQIRRDLELALVAARRHDIPLIVGTAGGSGAAPHCAMFRDILLGIARQHNLHFKLASISADISADLLLAAKNQHRLTPCGAVADPSESAVRDCLHLVAQMGTEPFIEALEKGADVVIAGRSCDTAVFAALPIMKGYDPALALHSAKIAECGTLCAEPGGANDALLVTLSADDFVVEPVNPDKRCLPHTVAAHSLYEQPSPHEFVEPEGTVDMHNTSFTATGGRAVRVQGTKLHLPDKSTVKVEGARWVGHRSLTIGGTCDPGVIANLDRIENEVCAKVRSMMAGTPDAKKVSLRFLRYGLDAVMGQPLPDAPPPTEVGLLIEAVAPTAALADTAVSLARSTALHQGFPGRKTTAGNLAFPFSPSDLRGGDVYEFAVYHLLQVDDARALFPISIENI